MQPEEADEALVPTSDSDDDFDWEEVDVPRHEPQLEPILEDYDEGPSVPVRQNIEITIQTRAKEESTAAKERAAAIQAARVARLDCHKVHTICLIANGQIRNRWLNDPLLHARLMSLTPMSIQNSFAMIHKSKIAEAAKRGRLFESAVTRLAEWWSGIFEIEPTGHVRSRTFEEVQAKIQAGKKGKGKARATEEDEESSEYVKSEKSLMKHALMKRGTRDTSAQLFTALCRALGIPARLVVSLQSVPWKAGVGKPKAPTKKKVKDKGKGKAKSKATTPIEESSADDHESDMEEVDISGVSTPSAQGKKKSTTSPKGNPNSDGGRSSTTTKAKGKRKATPAIKLRGSRGKKSESTLTETPPRELRSPDPKSTPPVYWTEVFSKADARWLPVDPIRCIINKRKAFDPSPSPNVTGKSDKDIRVENRMVYVVAFEEDGYARDVTPRYAREFGAKVAKMQQGGRGRQQWWEQIMGLIHRPYRLNRDDLEDEELHINQMTEQMPTSMAGFKDHPLYALARHLKRDEVIHPLVELGKFRGEPVYPRSSVVTLKTAENWMRQGRKVREGCQPMKWVKQRAVTVNRKRAIEMAMSGKDDLDVAGEGGVGSEKDVMQGLYSLGQTELYVPDPVIDGKVPKNDFGNIDLYVPSMLPAGAAHLPYKGIGKLAKTLGFDYADAVVGFEFRKGRAFPINTGIVVAAENEDTLLEAYWEAEHDAEQKRQAKRQEQVLKRWTRLIHGLRIHQRLKDQYADRGTPPTQGEPSSSHPGLDEHVPVAGGFLAGADDVVQRYTLPRNVHEVVMTSSPIRASSPLVPVPAASSPPTPLRPNSNQDTTKMDIIEITDSEEEEEKQRYGGGANAFNDNPRSISPLVSAPNPQGVPKTMRELAQHIADQNHNNNNNRNHTRTRNRNNRKSQAMAKQEDKDSGSDHDIIEIVSGSEDAYLDLPNPTTPSHTSDFPNPTRQTPHQSRRQLRVVGTTHKKTKNTGNGIGSSYGNGNKGDENGNGNGNGDDEDEDDRDGDGDGDMRTINGDGRLVRFNGNEDGRKARRVARSKMGTPSGNIERVKRGNGGGSGRGRVSGRGSRKRGRDEVDDESGDDDSVVDLDADAEAEDDGGDGGDDDDSGGDVGEVTSPRKRRKTKTGRSSTIQRQSQSQSQNTSKRRRKSGVGDDVVVVKSDRVLRTRKPKNEVKAREEREMEEAFKRATEE